MKEEFDKHSLGLEALRLIDGSVSGPSKLLLKISCMPQELEASPSTPRTGKRRDNKKNASRVRKI